MADVTDRHLEMARLYLVGPPEVRQNWAAAGRAAGFERVPGRNNKTLAEAFSRIQAEIDLQERAGVLALVPDAAPDAAPGAAPDEPDEPEDEDVLELEALLADQSAPNWEDMVPLAKRILAKIAAGRVKSDSSRLAALREILKQHAATPAEDPDTRFGPVKVIVLPAFVTEDGLVFVEGFEA